MKSHFLYTKQQRNGILLLLNLIVVIQLVYHFVDFKKDNAYSLGNEEFIAFQYQIDSLKQIAIENSKPKIYPFNPNFITDYKGYQLGMSVEEIDRLHRFREKGKYVNSTKDFQLVTQVSDSLLKTISTYFKFPSWTQKRKHNDKITRKSFDHKIEKDETLLSTTDINLATMIDFLVVEGVDEDLAERIVDYRKKLQGFHFKDQLYEVWNLDKSVADHILKNFSIQSSPKIEKLNVNTTSFKKLLKIPYIDYDLCVKIFDYRDEVAELQDISELKSIEGFPLHKYDRIVVYLSAE